MHPLMHPWSESLLSVLLESSLRTVFIAAGVAATLALLRARSSSVQHATWVAVLCAMLLMPVLPWFIPAIGIPGRIPAIALPSPQTIEVTGESRLPNRPTSIAVTPLGTRGDRMPEPSRASTKPASRLDWPGMLAGLYALVLAFFFIRLAAGWFALRRVLRGSVRVALAGRPPIFESPSIASPLTLGVLRPSIVLPIGWRVWPRPKRRAILVHEIAHIRRRDPLFRFLSQVQCCIFWFNPVSFWLRNRLASTSEHACDEAAVRVTGQPQRYAEILIDVAKSVRLQGSRLSLAGLGVHGNGQVARRIDRVLALSRIPNTTSTRKMIIAVTCGALVFLAIACRRQNSEGRVPGMDADIFLSPANADVLLSANGAILNMSLGAKIEKLEGVKSVTPVRLVLVLDPKPVVNIFGIDPRSFNEVAGDFVYQKGKLFSRPDEIVIDDIFSTEHKLDVGDSIELRNHSYKVSGIVKHGKGGRVFMALESAESLMNARGMVSAFFIKLQDSSNVNGSMDKIGKVLPGYQLRNVREFEETIAGK